MAGFMDKIKKFVGSDDLEDEYDDYEEEAVVEKQPKSVGESYARNAGNKLAFEKEKSNVVTMPNISRFLISIREPITFDDGTQVLDDVLKGKVVVLNLEMLEVDKKRQILCHRLG